MASAQELWQSVRREAEAIAGGDPVLATSLAKSILDHPGLGRAIAFQIGQRLGSKDDERALFARVAGEVFAASPELVEAASLDLEGIVRHDPAVTALLPPLLNFKGYVALQAWRVSNWLWQHGRTDFALMMQSASSERLQVSIHPSASIGTSVFLDHATGIIIGAHSVIGDDVTILQNVTITSSRNLTRGEMEELAIEAVSDGADRYGMEVDSAIPVRALRQGGLGALS